TAQYFSDPAGNRQERIIPFQKFKKNYLNIIYNPAFPDILTVTEKELLKLLNQYAFMDGKCYPKQTTLAAKLNCTTRQIRRLIKKLEQKGFIEVERPGLVERHIFKQSIHYFFLWHPAYETVMSPEMSGEITPDTFININQQILKAPAVPIVDPKEFDFDHLFAKINGFEVRFNPSAFFGKYIKLFPVDALKETLKAVLKKLSSGVDKCFDTWGYAIAIIKRIGPNYNEAEYIKEEQQRFEDMPDPDEIWDKMIKECEEEEKNLVYIPEDELPEGVPTVAQLRAMICGEDKVPEFEELKSEEPEPVEEEKSEIDQIPTQINQHKTLFNPSTFIDNHIKNYTTESITQVLLTKILTNKNKWHKVLLWQVLDPGG
ncbi:MAG: helix-turn-helix domain-containing protein, partial [Deltaproteobacteria bacterium]|nr:helix-turn-helix domain-containing protein [Deltaproteobacteria bacterium]